MIISGHTYVSPEGQAGSRQLAVLDDRYIAPHAEMANAVHRAGSTIILQLAHSGCRAPTELTGKPAIGPSALSDKNREYCREMRNDDIRRLQAAFASGAKRAQAAGFDGVQLHAAHGYLLSQFLSPLWNKRSDNYGGPVENRARMLVETTRAVREAVGRDFAVMAKINCEDFLDGGFTVNDMVAVCSMLEQEGLDAVEMSGGTFYSGSYQPSRTGKAACLPEEAYYTAAAEQYKKAIKLPLILVGGIRSYEVAEALIKEGKTDYVAFCRPLIAEPGLIRRWESGSRERADCKSDNLCFKPAFADEGFYCVLKEKRKTREAAPKK
jgi:2,4-dienoyl-CoA reductase-like NADH-dependent reductase (Old Yellow Enzyme family)